MAAQSNDALAAERNGIVGKITAGDIADLVPPVFMAMPDILDESEVYFYLGWMDQGGWLVRRIERATSAVVSANEINNNSYADLTAAWIDRATLTYESL